MYPVCSSYNIVMSAGQRLPEDIAAEQAYIAELRLQQEAADRQKAAARRAALEAQGLLSDMPDSAASAARDVLAPRPPETNAAPVAPLPAPVAAPPGMAAPARPSGGIAPEKLASLSPEALAKLPAEVREMILEAQAQQRAESGAVPAAYAPPVSAPTAVEASAAMAASDYAAPAAPTTMSPFEHPSAAPAPALGIDTQLSEEEVARRQAEVLRKVQWELAESNSVLVATPRQRGLFWRILRFFDNLTGLFFGRKSTW